MPVLTSKEFKDFRRKIGFTDAAKAKKFLDAKDIKPIVDFIYVEALNARLVEILSRVYGILPPSSRPPDFDGLAAKVQNAYNIIKRNQFFKLFTNQGRRSEKVYFNWMRGYAVAELFLPALSRIFGVPILDIKLIGDDDLYKPETFKRSHKPDFELPGQSIRVEFQSGFQNANQIKKGKYEKSLETYAKSGLHTWVFHVDLYNGYAALVPLSQINKGELLWKTSSQMEGQTVFDIPQKYYFWKLTDEPLIFELIKQQTGA